MIKNALIIFVRNPELGKVKTRLAKTIGDQNALVVYNDLLYHTMNETRNLNCDKFLFYDNKIEKNDIWEEKYYNKTLQKGIDLGEKMRNAFETILNLGYQNCIIVGSDLFDLKENLIKNAFQKLKKNDVVIGPAEDGGYYLLGLKKIPNSIFQLKDWGNPTVLKDTLDDLKDYKIKLLDTLNDIDTFEDLEKSGFYKGKNKI